MPQLTLDILASSGSVQVTVPDRRALFILGRNGTGKSALVHRINQRLRTLGTSVVYLPGSRPSYFEGESLNMTPNTRSQYEVHSVVWDAQPQTRIRPVSGVSRNERAIYDLQAAEVQYRVEAANQIQAEGAASLAIARLQSKSSPLDRVNRLLSQSNLPVEVAVEHGELKARRGSSIYSISNMSDGERTALIFVSDVISAKPGTVFLVDEPELHLHRSIIVPLLTALINERPDCTVVVSTHELALVNDHPESPILLVRGCVWSGDNASAWDVVALPDSERVPDDLRIDLLGSRQTVLFIEGIAASRDQPLYAILFPSISIRHRSTCTDVRRAVVGLRQVEAFHHARAFGLVDNDGVNASFAATLRSENVFPLAVFAVESLYYSSHVIDAVAVRQAGTLGIDPATLVATARERALTTLRQSGRAEHLAARVAERRMRDEMLTAIPSRATMIASGDAPLAILVPSPYPKALARIRALIEANDLDAIVAGFPVRESGILDDIAKGLRFVGDVDYEKAALTAISIDSDLASKLKTKLGDLADQLQ